MENCTLYSHQLNFEKVIEIVQSTLPKASMEYKDGGKQKSLLMTIKGSLFSKPKTLKINYRERLNPSYTLEKAECGLTQNLAGMLGFIESLSTRNEALKQKFRYKVMSANCEMPFIAEPEINADFEAVLRKITSELDCFVFAQPNRFFSKSAGQHFLDKNLNLILDTSGNWEVEDLEVSVDAKYHDQAIEEVSEGQLARKTKSEAFLTENGIKVNKNLPSVPSDEQVELRNEQEVLDRAYALLIIAVKGEGIEQEHLERTVADKEINSFTPEELHIYHAAALNDRERAYATWRYESLYTLLWALGMMDELKYPSEICDVQAVVGAIFHPNRAAVESQAKLRSESIILDELDKTYRMNWACVDARINGQEPAGGIMPSVVYERHYALNWLTKHGKQDWDDVQTPT
jgi:Domain of unknown function (DUF4272)